MDYSQIVQLIQRCADLVHSRIHELDQHDPKNETFKQLGILNGQSIINDYLAHDEWGLALEHLLYMIDESDIEFPTESAAVLLNMAKQHDLRSNYPLITGKARRGKSTSSQDARSRS